MKAMNPVKLESLVKLIKLVNLVSHALLCNHKSDSKEGAVQNRHQCRSPNYFLDVLICQEFDET